MLWENESCAFIVLKKEKVSNKIMSDKKEHLLLFAFLELSAMIAGLPPGQAEVVEYKEEEIAEIFKKFFQ